MQKSPQTNHNASSPLPAHAESPRLAPSPLRDGGDQSTDVKKRKETDTNGTSSKRTRSSTDIEEGEINDQDKRTRDKHSREHTSHSDHKRKDHPRSDREEGRRDRDRDTDEHRRRDHKSHSTTHKDKDDRGRAHHESHDRDREGKRERERGDRDGNKGREKERDDRERGRDRDGRRDHDKRDGRRDRDRDHRPDHRGRGPGAHSHHHREHNNGTKTDNDGGEDPIAEIEIIDEEEKQRREEERIAESRRRRQEMMAKLAAETPAQAQASTSASATSTPASIPAITSTPTAIHSSSSAKDTNASQAPSTSPRADDGYGSDDDEARSMQTMEYTAYGEGASGQDDDQDALERQDHEDRLRFHGMKAAPAPPPPTQAALPPGRGESADKFATSTDMFSDSPTLPAVTFTALSRLSAPGVEDNWDDADGYYRFRAGEVIGRYHVFGVVGSGVFSSVVRARDQITGSDVAIKIIRNNETMYKAGTKELGLLRTLQDRDPEDKRHIIRLLNSVEHRNHLCLVFEPMSMNLRQVVKKYGRGVGLGINAVRVYAKQLFIALKHIKTCGILHADIKPDNIVVNESKTLLKMCDFGSGSSAEEPWAITPYLVSRFYRAPEIMLGLPYDHAIDMWSVGVTLAELFMGKVLFPGQSNNEMLRLIMDYRGPIPKKMLRKATLRELHFDEDFYFLQKDVTSTGLVSTKTVNVTQINKDLMNALVPSGNASKIPEADMRKIQQLRDLLDKCLSIDPAKRITPDQALHHPFLRPT